MVVIGISFDNWKCGFRRQWNGCAKIVLYKRAKEMIIGIF